MPPQRLPGTRRSTRACGHRRARCRRPPTRRTAPPGPGDPPRSCCRAAMRRARHPGEGAPRPGVRASRSSARSSSARPGRSLIARACASASADRPQRGLARGSGRAARSRPAAPRPAATPSAPPPGSCRCRAGPSKDQRPPVQRPSLRSTSSRPNSCSGQRGSSTPRRWSLGKPRSAAGTAGCARCPGRAAPGTEAHARVDDLAARAAGLPGLGPRHGSCRARSISAAEPYARRAACSWPAGRCARAAPGSAGPGGAAAGPLAAATGAWSGTSSSEPSNGLLPVEQLVQHHPGGVHVRARRPAPRRGYCSGLM